MPSRHADLKRSNRFVGLLGAARAWLLGELTHDSRHAVVVCPTRQAAEELFEDLLVFVGRERVVLYPGWESLPFEPVSPSAQVSAERLSMLIRAAKADPFILVASADTLMQRVLPSRLLERLIFSLNTGCTYDRTGLTVKLENAGFRRVSVVEEVGQYAVRGAVVDFFPGRVPSPLRLEFSGEQLAEIRTFDPDSQRSLGVVNGFEVRPVRESVPIDVSAANGVVRQDAEERIKACCVEAELAPREVAKLLQELESGIDYPGREWLEFAIHPRPESFFESLPASTEFFVVDEPAIRREIENFGDLVTDRRERLVADRHFAPPLAASYLSADEFVEAVFSKSPKRLDHVEYGVPAGADRKSVANIDARSNVELSTRLKSNVGSGKALQPLAAFVDRWRKKHYDIAFAVGSAARAERLQSILLELGIAANLFPGAASSWIHTTNRYPVVILHGHLSAGCQIPGSKLVFISENEIFHERSYRRNQRRTSLKRILSSLSNLSEDNYVVHADYGVGIYRGLKHLTIEGTLGDFLQIDYADSKLFLPVQNIARIQKFVAAEGQKPVIDKLGSTRWFRTKQKIRESVITLAGDLIRLYATRKGNKGWRYEPYGAEDDRFADGFPYDETPDQKKAIGETLADMAAEKPMDRLVCGDVGFGKTEVAIRAAFKCTQHARQVAVLVPTTILVEQHRANFAARFEGYPVRVAAVSRFFSAQENKRTLEALAAGEVDIIIGTHRLLQSDVLFKDLGLLIIDEEHRFGVKQKERLKQMRTQVDVLTLTATPIPRTLHMSLLNIRDISVITTAPTDRRSVQTFVAEKDDSLIRDAILREIRRGGQVFFLHNRVTNIEVVRARLAELVPEAKFDFAHGQMNEHDLERIMKRFVDKQFDVLVTTTIVESGLDIPNANTILIDRADTFGLAQLYQLRGRVGRSARQAFAYLLVGNRKSLGADAQKRLKVLQSLDQLGVGFNLAIRDLEIRGAGNLLGKEQSGNVLAVGFDTYCKILEEAVHELKGEEPALEDTVDPEVKFVGLDAFIPEPYIPDIGERLVMYQRLANIRSFEEAENLRTEMEDRFGPLLNEVSNLLDLMRYRSLVRSYGITRAEIGPARFTLTFTPLAILEDKRGVTANTRVDGLKVIDLVRQNPQTYRFNKNMTLSVSRFSQEAPAVMEIYRETERLLRRIGHISEPAFPMTAG